MQLKSITAIVVLLLVVASLLVSGCTSGTTSNTNQTPSASTATHDAFLEKYLAAYKNTSYSDKDRSVRAWELTWINSTSARLEWAFLNKTVNTTGNYVQTLMVFPTTRDATNYLNAMNKTAYSLASTQYPSEGTFRNATGHAPTVYKEYVWNEGNPFNLSDFKYHDISQLDNIIVVTTGKWLG